MKITHICLTGPVTDGWTYQDNMLTKYHRRLGYDVDLITSKFVWDSSGRIVVDDREDYLNSDSVHVVRICSRFHSTINSKIRFYKGLMIALKQSNPDILFIHGVQFPGISTIVRYLRRNKSIIVYVDNHSDFSNSATSWISKNIQHKVIWKYFAKKIEPYVRKFYGVTPARVDFLVDMYDLPRERVDLLVMGADDDQVNCISSSKINEIKSHNNIYHDDFLLVSGGKIDQWKKQTLLLMDAVNELKIDNLKLIVFGSVAPELKEEVQKRCSERVKYIGWVKPEESYSYFAASSIAVFPGRHSVFWEQVVGQGVPIVCKYWKGTTHVNYNGNAEFLYEDSKEEMMRVISSIMNSPKYEKMRDNALIAKDFFLYSTIAKRSIESEKNEKFNE